MNQFLRQKEKQNSLSYKYHQTGVLAVKSVVQIFFVGDSRKESESKEPENMDGREGKRRWEKV
jgi:hypothetical protein